MSNETKTKINEKLLQFQTSVEAIKKDGKNTFFKKPDGKPSSYATLPNILSEVKPMLNALKITIKQPILNGEVFTILTDTETGEEVVSSIPLTSGLNAQQRGSEITYFRRYTLTSLLALEIDEDDDGNHASQSPKKEQTKPKPQLTQDGFDKMRVAISNGQADAVIKSLSLYSISPEFLDELNKLLK